MIVRQSNSTSVLVAQVSPGGEHFLVTVSRRDAFGRPRRARHYILFFRIFLLAEMGLYANLHLRCCYGPACRGEGHVIEDGLVPFSGDSLGWRAHEAPQAGSTAPPYRTAPEKIASRNDQPFAKSRNREIWQFSAPTISMAYPHNGFRW